MGNKNKQPSGISNGGILQNSKINNNSAIPKNDQPPKSKGGCFGSKKEVSNYKKGDKSTFPQRGQTSHKTQKSSIQVKSVKNITVQQQLFQGRQKQQIDIRLNRAQPYQILKDQDYFDSQHDVHDLVKVRQVHDNCQIANYQTPDLDNLRTVQVKTYLFDRNLTKIARVAA